MMMSLLGWILFLSTTPTAWAENNQSLFTSEQKEEVTQLIQDYIQKHPDVVVKSLQDFSNRQQKEALEKMKIKVEAAALELADASTAIMTSGISSAPVKIILFVDPNCIHCRIFESILYKIEKELPQKDKLCILIRPWPILGKDSLDIAEGMIAVSQDSVEKFKILSEKILKDEKIWDKEILLALAQTVGYEKEKLISLMKTPFVQDRLKKTNELASQLGFESTPTIVLVDKKGARLIQVGDEKGLKALLLETLKDS